MNELHPNGLYPAVRRSASISADHLYRWSLVREWNREQDRLCALMLNPSFADADRDDPTVRRLIGYASRWGYGSFVLVNLSAWRSTESHDVWRQPNGGRVNRSAVLAAARDRDVFVGWGDRAERMRVYTMDLATRVQEVSRSMFCLGETRLGHPKHPLRLAYSVERRAWP